MITLPAGARILLATRPVDFRKGAHSLTALAAEMLGEDPFSGMVLVFRAKRGHPGPGLLAHVLVSKYVDGLPLYRLSGLLAREGVEIERQTLADWVGHAAWWLRPLAEAIGRQALGQQVIWTDDMPIQVLAPGRGKTREARVWVYAHDPRPWGGTEPPVALYSYSADRKGERPQSHLAGFQDWVHADGFAGYNGLWRPQQGQPAMVQHVACWAHARRYLFDEFERTRSPIAEEGLRRIQTLYAIEAELRGLPAEHRRAERQARSRPCSRRCRTGWRRSD